MNANELAKRIVKTALVNGEWCLGLDLPVGGIWEACESKEHAEACAARIRPALAQAVDQVVSWRVREILRGPRIIYLASPYSHPLPEVREARFRTVCRVAARLMSEGAIVFSPIAHSHPIAMAGQLPTDWTFWDRYDRAMLEASAELWVLQLDGWRTSTGVVAEIDIATHLGLPIQYIEALPGEVEDVKTAGVKSLAVASDEAELVDLADHEPLPYSPGYGLRLRSSQPTQPISVSSTGSTCSSDTNSATRCNT